jgi:hypothetical protein
VFMAFLGGAVLAPSVGYADRPAGRVPVVGVIASERFKAALLEGLGDAGYDVGTDLTVNLVRLLQRNDSLNSPTNWSRSIAT